MFFHIDTYVTTPGGKMKAIYILISSVQKNAFSTVKLMSWVHTSSLFHILIYVHTDDDGRPS